MTRWWVTAVVRQVTSLPFEIAETCWGTREDAEKLGAEMVAEAEAYYMNSTCTVTKIEEEDE